MCFLVFVDGDEVDEAKQGTDSGSKKEGELVGDRAVVLKVRAVQAPPTTKTTFTA